VNFDPVHDTQTVYRALVQAFSYPGVAFPIEGPSSRGAHGSLPGEWVAVARTLLDAQTSFWSPTQGNLSELTGAKRRADTEAAFLLLPWWDESSWTTAFDRARRGTLADPHLGATVISWAPASTPTQAWIASGPGLEHPSTLRLPGNGPWLAARNRACGEFPLGVDWIWAQEKAVVALPRTTRLVPAGREA